MFEISAVLTHIFRTILAVFGVRYQAYDMVDLARDIKSADAAGAARLAFAEGRWSRADEDELVGWVDVPENMFEKEELLKFDPVSGTFTPHGMNDFALRDALNPSFDSQSFKPSFEH